MDVVNLPSNKPLKSAFIGKSPKKPQAMIVNNENMSNFNKRSPGRKRKFSTDSFKPKDICSLESGPLLFKSKYSFIKPTEGTLAGN